MDPKCKKCTQSFCCQSISQEVTKINYDRMLWQIAHDNVELVSTSNGKKWYIIFNTPCSQLQEDGLCAIYPTRPNVCKEYSSVGCEFDEPKEDRWARSPSIQHFKTYDQLLEYLTKRKLV